MLEILDNIAITTALKPWFEDAGDTG